MPTPDDVIVRTAAAYNAAADRYDDPANAFWERFGRATVERLRLAPGSRILDVCCGSGASALPAAAMVGPTGSVLGIDLAEKLLELARAKAATRSLGNAEFRLGDILDLRLPADHFDAVVCVFGIFFVPDMPAAVRALWQVLRRGGKLAVTTWGPRFFEPASTAFWDAVREVRPDLHKGFNAWDRISEASELQAILSGGGARNVEVVAEPGAHSISSPEAWWAAVLGSGFRGTLEQMDTDARERVRAANLSYISSSGTRSVEANVLYALAAKA
jgi:ubiquinone/menaquinone biosynthesis C-methylase UbiE